MTVTEVIFGMTGTEVMHDAVTVWASNRYTRRDQPKRPVM
jgi:hypothetical protein